MDWFAPFVHILNFLAPALWLATLMVMLHRTLWRRHRLTIGWARQWRWLFGVGALVLVLGLLLQQRDGAMLTYLALAVGIGLVQTWLVRRFRVPDQDSRSSVSIQ